jgi:hypothetical protein
VFEQQSAFGVLDGDREFTAGIVLGKGGAVLDEIDERCGLPVATVSELTRGLAAVGFDREFLCGCRQVRIDRMVPHTPEPVLRIPVVRFASVEDGVDQRRVGVRQVLHQAVSGVQVIVPKEHQSLDEFPLASGQSVAARQFINLF